jgi:hypothetical protein
MIIPMDKHWLLLPLLLVACSKTAPPPEPIRPVKVITIQAQTNGTELALAGEVKARYESPLAFRVGG